MGNADHERDTEAVLQSAIRSLARCSRALQEPNISHVSKQHHFYKVPVLSLVNLTGFLSSLLSPLILITWAIS